MWVYPVPARLGNSDTRQLDWLARSGIFVPILQYVFTTVRSSLSGPGPCAGSAVSMAGDLYRSGLASTLLVTGSWDLARKGPDPVGYHG
jgi:hypothetical protein